MRKIFSALSVLIVIVMLSSSAFSFAESAGPRMNLGSYYDFSGQLDRDQIAGLSLLMPEFLNYGADKLILGSNPENQSATERALRLLAAGIPLAILEIPTVGASHEYGHFLSFEKMGMREPEFINEYDYMDRYKATPFNAYLLMLNATITGENNYSASQSKSEWKEFWNDSERSKNYVEYVTMMEAGGLNQNQYNVEILADKVLGGYAHPLDIIVYLTNATATTSYPLGENSDIIDYISRLEQRGIKANHGEIKITTQIPKLFSNSSISLLMSIVDYWKTGDKKVEPLALNVGQYKLYWPEFASYLTLYGPTVKVSQRNDLSRHTLTFSMEKSLSVDMYETGIAWKSALSDKIFVEAKALKNFGEEGGTWIEGGPTLKLYSWFSVGVKGYYGDGYTFTREIKGHVPNFINKKESGAKAFAKISIKY